MASIATGANPERTNRWLLIGAVVLATSAGVLIFVALANTVSDDGGTTSAGSGDARALVANDNIPAGTELEASMFQLESFSEDALVPGALFDAKEVEGLVTRTEVLKNQQLSGRAVGVADDGRPTDPVLSDVLDQGTLAVSVSVKEVTAVGGHLVPGDRVDLFVNIVERVPNADYDLLHVVPAFQNVKVVSRAQTDIESIVNLAEDDEQSADATSPDATERPEDVDPTDARAQTITVQLSPEDTQTLIMQMKLADEVWFALRPFGDAGIAPLEEIVVRISKNR